MTSYQTVDNVVMGDRQSDDHSDTEDTKGTSSEMMTVHSDQEDQDPNTDRADRTDIHLVVTEEQRVLTYAMCGYND